jgi:ATP adenylyltransferase
LDRLWSPWRAKYIASGVDAQRDVCVFCEIASNLSDDDDNFVIFRGERCFVVLNLFPYISGHLMVIPYEHLGDLASTDKAITDEMMDLTKRAQIALRNVYQPGGFNVGMNLGASAGAGIVDHIHIHVLPRWGGDTNFMTTVAETRVLPEDLKTTHQRLREKF